MLDALLRFQAAKKALEQLHALKRVQLEAEAREELGGLALPGELVEGEVREARGGVDGEFSKDTLDLVRDSLVHGELLELVLQGGFILLGLEEGDLVGLGGAKAGEEGRGIHVLDAGPVRDVSGEGLPQGVSVARGEADGQGVECALAEEVQGQGRARVQRLEAVVPEHVALDVDETTFVALEVHRGLALLRAARVLIRGRPEDHVGVGPPHGLPKALERPGVAHGGRQRQKGALHNADEALERGTLVAVEGVHLVEDCVAEPKATKHLVVVLLA
mmetsp:Transcript_11975/g.34565  ORF Transcript_11975/g.34565 Transcript_11975/m.34565 type:complete len:275 (+) Transcript_11975:961-1785(+)